MAPSTSRGKRNELIDTINQRTNCRLYRRGGVLPPAANEKQTDELFSCRNKWFIRRGRCSSSSRYRHNDSLWTLYRSREGKPLPYGESTFESRNILSATKKDIRLDVLFYGGKGGIRTLERVLAVTRFPVVRLRPAQPPFRVRSLNRSAIISQKKTIWTWHQNAGNMVF